MKYNVSIKKSALKAIEKLPKKRLVTSLQPFVVWLKTHARPIAKSLKTLTTPTESESVITALFTPLMTAL